MHRYRATDGRELRMKRYTKSEKTHQLLLDQLDFTTPLSRRPKSESPSRWWRLFEKMSAV